MNAHPVETVKTVIAANAEQFEIEPHLWARNQQQQHLLLRYLALPLRENEQTLWLGVDSPANLAACETFSFLTGKIVEPVLLESHQLKTLLQELAPQITQIEENPLFYATLQNQTNR